jgi:pantoate--beta-alanine ligase
MSSRNPDRSASERPVAARIHAALQGVRASIAAGAAIAAAEAAAAEALRAAGFEVDYVAVRRRDLAEAAPDDAALVVLAAARLGRTRLIDNLEFERGAGR